MNDSKLITFDDECHVRVLDADKYAASLRLQESCASFESKTDELKESARKYITMLENVADSIEAEKLRAIGLRNKVGALKEAQAAGAEDSKRRKQELQKVLDALAQEETSLQAVVEEQAAQISRLKGQSLV